MYLSRFLLEIALSGEKVGRGGGRESRKFTAKDLGQLGGRWSDQAGSLIKGLFRKEIFTLTIFALSRFQKKSIFFFRLFLTSKCRWYSGEHSCLPSS